MYHTIEFNVTGMIDLEVARKQALERLCVERGCDLAERARRMIAIAAPQFRDALLHASRSGEA